MVIHTWDTEVIDGSPCLPDFDVSTGVLNTTLHTWTALLYPLRNLPRVLHLILKDRVPQLHQKLIRKLRPPDSSSPGIELQM